MKETKKQKTKNGSKDYDLREEMREVVKIVIAEEKGFRSEKIREKI